MARRDELTGWSVRPLPILCLLWLAAPPPAAAQDEERIAIRVDSSQAEAVLAVLDLRRGGRPVGEGDWRRLFESEPYRRLQQREAAMQRAFTDDEFREFVLSDSLAGRAGDLRRTLEEWSTRDLEASARRVVRYLPPDARIHATIYPVIKPKTNSFVYDLRTDPAVFLFLDPEQSAARFENTVAHEMHHIGFASVTAPADSTDADLPAAVRTARDWMGAFGEGFAMLAAAGGTGTHPHEASPAEDRARWDRDVANFDRDLRELESFFRDIIEGRLATEDEVNQRGFSFFGVQGPWYTVGYTMATVVERRFGREELIAGMADPPRLLPSYNAAVAQQLADGGEPRATWSPDLLEEIGADLTRGEREERR